jgi:hypothetical protein
MMEDAMAKISIDEDLAREAMRALDDAAAAEWDANGASEVYDRYDTLGFKLHIALGGCGMTITSEPEPEPATEELTEDEREALREVVRDYAYYVRNAGVGLILEPDVMRNRVELAEQAVRKVLGDEFGAQTKKEP